MLKDQPESTSVKRSWWEVLGIPKDSNNTTIRYAYINLAKKLHPDVGGSTEEFQELQQAFNESGGYTNII